MLLFLAPLGCSDKAESPAPEAPPEEQPVQPSEEYKEMYHSMEDNIKDEEPSLYYTYFRMRNASDQPLYIAAEYEGTHTDSSTTSSRRNKLRIGVV